MAAAASSSREVVLLMHMTRETIEGNKLFLSKLGDHEEGHAIATIREKTIQWLLNVRNTPPPPHSTQPPFSDTNRPPRLPPGVDGGVHFPGDP